MSPARSRYSVTTLEPGASDVLTHGWLVSPRATALRASSPAPSMTEGLEVFVHDVMAAMTTCPWSTLNVAPSIVTSAAVSECSAITVPAATARAEAGAAGGSWPGALSAGGSEAGKVSATASSWELATLLLGVAADEVGQRRAEGVLRAVQRHAILRALGAGQRGHDVAEVELDGVGVRRLLGVLVVPEALLLGVGLDEVDELLRAPGEGHVAQRLGVDREDRARRAELGAHVADGRPVGERQPRHARPVELDELAHDPLLAQQLGDREHEVGRRGALGQLAVELEAEHLRDEHRHRLAEHRRLGLDAADAPAEHAEAVDHRRVRVGADERVGVGVAVVVDEDHAREVLEVDLVDDPGVGRHDREAVEGVLAPAQERVALVVALELALGVEAEGVVGAEDVDLDRVVDDQLGGHERVDLRASPPRSAIASRIAARSTTAGTPVKSCRITRAGVKAISSLGSALASQRASFSTSSAVTEPLPSVRSRFSSSTLRLKGSRATSYFDCRASRRKIVCSRSPTFNVSRASNEFG